MTSPDEHRSADGDRSFDMELEHALCEAQPSRFGNVMRAIWAALPSGWLLILLGVLIALIFTERSANHYRDDLAAIQEAMSVMAKTSDQIDIVMFQARADRLAAGLKDVAPSLSNGCRTNGTQPCIISPSPDSALLGSIQGPETARSLADSLVRLTKALTAIATANDPPAIRAGLLEVSSAVSALKANPLAHNPNKPDLTTASNTPGIVLPTELSLEGLSPLGSVVTAINNYQVRRALTESVQTAGQSFRSGCLTLGSVLAQSRGVLLEDLESVVDQHAARLKDQTDKAYRENLAALLGELWRITALKRMDAEALAHKLADVFLLLDAVLKRETSEATLHMAAGELRLMSDRFRRAVDDARAPSPSASNPHLE
jgi:hypothetical protein